MSFLFSGLPLGRFFGIRVVVSWLFFIFAGLWIFGHGGNSAVTLFNAVFIVFLFAIVLLHEFGHSLACRAVKGKADLIVLWPLGGLAFCEPPQRPWPQLITTVCGPLVNVALLVITWALQWVLRDVAVSPWVILVLMASWEVNVLLLVFNLMPIYPMDGGRILQELLWFVIGLPRSLIVAGMIGTVAGGMLALIGFGLLPPLKLPIDLPFLNRPSSMLGVIGLMAAFESFAAYKRGQELASRYR